MGSATHPRTGRPMKHLLVTNDFPPKVGGIQTYLWELWRRLPPDEHRRSPPPRGCGGLRRRTALPDRPDRASRPAADPVRWPRGSTRLADEVGADARGARSRRCRWACSALGWSRPYGVVVHGAEVSVPGRLPLRRRPLRRVLRGASARHRRGRLSRRARRDARPRRTSADRRRPTRGRHRALRAARPGGAGGRPAPASGSTPTCSSCSASAGWCPARASTCSSKQAQC